MKEIVGKEEIPPPSPVVVSRQPNNIFLFYFGILGRRYAFTMAHKSSRIRAVGSTAPISF